MGLLVYLEQHKTTFGVIGVYRRLIFHNVPSIRFAHAFSTERYDIRFPSDISRLELTFAEKGDIVQEMEGCERAVFPEGGFKLFAFDRPMRLYSHASPCSHLTVGVEADYSIECISRENMIAANRAEDGGGRLTVFCPAGSVFPEGGAMEAAMRRLIVLFGLPDAAQSLRCTAILFEMLASLTEETVRQAMVEEGGLPPSGVLYARKAMRLISAHLTEKLTVDGIAEQLGVSSGYLSALFKAYTGNTIINYINAIRVERMKDLLLTKSIKLKEAGESVGLSDENYMSRLFRRYSGQSVREFLRANRSDPIE